MTAEEVALRRFRAAVELARCHRRESALAARIGNAVEEYAHRRLSNTARDTAIDIADIIRAIRAERTPFHAMEKRLAGSIEGGIEAGIELIKARAYEQGRRDALRGVQAACLFEMGRLEEEPRKYGGEFWDWEGHQEEMHAYDALCEVAEAAEEAAANKGGEGGRQ